MAAGPVDAVELLSGQHRMVEALWRRIEHARPPDAGAVRSIVRLLWRHDAVETAVRDPELWRLPGGKAQALVDDGARQHRRMRGLLQVVDRADDIDAATLAVLRDCIGIAVAHIAVEEGEVFPLLCRHRPPRRLRELGGAMQDLMRSPRRVLVRRRAPVRTGPPVRTVPTA